MNAARLTIVRNAAPATVTPASTTKERAPLRQIRNAKVQGTELLDAIAFLADALQIPALRVAGVVDDTTARFTNVVPFRTRR